MANNLFSILPSRHHALAEQFIKFCLVGFSNLVIDFSVYFFATRVFHLYFVLANVCSFAVAISWSFWLNKRWTFRNDNRDYRQYLKFFIINVSGMLWQTTLLYLLVTVWRWHDLLAKGLAVVIVTFWNFSLSRWWAFRQLA